MSILFGRRSNTIRVLTLAIGLLAGGAHAGGTGVLTLVPGTGGCVDSLPLTTRAVGTARFVSALGEQATLRLINTTRNVLAAGPTVTGGNIKGIARLGASSIATPEIFPAPGEPGHVFRFCATNDVSAATLTIQLDIDGL